MTDDRVVIAGRLCPCTVSECGVAGAGVLHRAVVELPDGRMVPGTHRSDRQAARMSAWFAAQRIWDATGRDDVRESARQTAERYEELFRLLGDS